MLKICTIIACAILITKMARELEKENLTSFIGNIFVLFTMVTIARIYF